MELIPLYQMPLSIVFLLFMIFSFVGWCSEVFYVGVFFEHRFINRGFLYGPLCPIYGCGGLVLLLLPPRLYNTWLPLFFSSVVLCDGVEYFISWLLEKLFHTLWWDYSHYKVNINGRICLVNSILFGIMGLVSIHWIIPFLYGFLNSFNIEYLRLIATIISVIFTADTLCTVRSLVDFTLAMEKIKNFGETIKENYSKEEWFLIDSFETMIESIKNKAESDKSAVKKRHLESLEKLQKSFNKTESLIKRFPTAKSTEYKNEFKLISNRLKKKLDFKKKSLYNLKKD